MNTTFDMGGIRLTISDGAYASRSSDGGVLGGCSDGRVSLLLERQPLTETDWFYAGQISLEPSHARAVASALLSTATQIQHSSHRL